MNEEEAQIYLVKRKEVKKAAKEKCIKALETGTPIFLDLVYEKKMNDTEGCKGL